MASEYSNVGLGVAIAYHDRVVNNDPTNAVLIVVPLETSGIVSDATFRDYDTLAALLAGATNEQSTMGRKTLSNADLSASAVNDTTDVREASLPDIVWTAAAGNAVSKFAVCYAPDSTALDDSTTIPLAYLDRALTPDTNDFELTGGVYLSAGHP